MVKIESKVDFGVVYEDAITGMKGKAVGVAIHQYGCIRIAIQPRVREDGIVPDPVWMDEEQLIDIEPVEIKTGGPAPNPKRRIDPKRR